MAASPVLIYQALISSFFRAAEEITGLHQSAHHQAQSVFFIFLYSVQRKFLTKRRQGDLFFPCSRIGKKGLYGKKLPYWTLLKTAGWFVSIYWINFFPFFRTDADVGLAGRLQHRYRLVTHLFIFIKVLIRVFF